MKNILTLLVTLLLFTLSPMNDTRASIPDDGGGETCNVLEMVSDTDLEVGTTVDIDIGIEKNTISYEQGIIERKSQRLNSRVNSPPLYGHNGIKSQTIKNNIDLYDRRSQVGLVMLC